jgi:hypothetical protein
MEPRQRGDATRLLFFWARLTPSDDFNKKGPGTRWQSGFIVCDWFMLVIVKMTLFAGARLWKLRFGSKDSECPSTPVALPRMGLMSRRSHI